MHEICWIGRLQRTVIAVWVFGNGYAAGLPHAVASCQTPECKEVHWYATYANLASPPAQRQVSGNERFDEKQAKTLYADGALGGTPTNHATKKNMKRTNCSPFNRHCATQLKDGTYEVSRWDDPKKEDQISNCSAKAQVDWAFCAGCDGEGVQNSWHQGKTKDQE